MDAPPMAPPVVAVIVTCDPDEWFEETLAAFGAQDYPNLSILVLDAGRDQEATTRVAGVLPGAYVRRLASGTGYSEAANHVFQLVKDAAYLVFCHDDVAPEPDAIRILVEEALRSNAGIVGPKVVDWFDPETDDAGPAEPGELPAPGRSRVLSAIGREGASERWYTGEHGPRSPIAHAAPAQWVSCGFSLPLSGELGRFFGACANAYAPDDGRVVSADHGCGAHSEAMADAAAARAVTPVIDEFGYDLVDLPGVSVEETVFEPLSRGAD